MKRVPALVVLLLSVLCLLPSQSWAEEAKKPFILHLNGIGGERRCDHTLIEGLRAGGVDADVQFYDWTGGEEGLTALVALERNHKEAKKIAELLTKKLTEDPQRPVYITCHSGGVGLAVWALEALPEELSVESVFMFAPALSPTYDLTAALKHVRKKVYVFSSRNDTLILSTGTKLFGTIDGVKVPAAGLNGFERPEGADEKQYAKLVPQPYDSSWLLRYGNAGSHICSLRTRFAREYVAPLLLTGEPPVAPAPAASATPRLLPMQGVSR